MKEWRNQTTSIFSTKENADTLGTAITPTTLNRIGSSNQMTRFHAAMSSLSFHPIEMLLGIGGVDGKLRIIGCSFGNWRVPDVEESGRSHTNGGGYLNGDGFDD